MNVSPNPESPCAQDESWKPFVMPLRILGTMTSLVLGFLAFATNRYATVMSELYGDFGAAPSWKLTALTCFASPIPMGLIGVFAIMLLLSTWRSPLQHAIWFILFGVLLSWSLVGVIFGGAMLLTTGISCAG